MKTARFAPPREISDRNLRRRLGELDPAPSAQVEMFGA
jgi:hypothetical protein